MRYLVGAFRESRAFRDLSLTTRRDKSCRLDWITAAIGEARYAAMTPHHVEKLMEKKGGPAAANRLRKDLSQLFRFAAKRLGFAGRNPASLADAHKEKSKGFHTWSDGEIDVFRNTFGAGIRTVAGVGPSGS